MKDIRLEILCCFDNQCKKFTKKHSIANQLDARHRLLEDWPLEGKKMKLRGKSTALLVATTIVLNLLIWVVASPVVLKSYDQLERLNTRANVERLVATWNDELAKMEQTLHDWATWDDSYNFLAGRLPGFVTDNLQDSAFAPIGLNVVVYTRLSGTLFFGKTVDARSGTEISLPSGFTSLLLSRDSPLLAVKQGFPSTMGLALLPDHVLLVAARPVLKNNGEGPPSGMLIMGRFLEDDTLRRFGDRIRLPVAARRMGDAATPPDFRQASQALSPDQPMTVQIKDASTMAGFALISDIFGKPGLVFKVENPRTIHAEGVRTIAFFLAAIFALSILVTALVWLIMHQLVIRRLGLLDREVARISVSGDIGSRVTTRGDDEVAFVAGAINTMLEALQQSQKAVAEAQKFEAVANLASGTAHEFNNILSIILGSIERAMKGMVDGSPSQVLLKQAYGAGTRAGLIVRQILDFSVSTRLPQLQIQLSETVRASLENLRPMLPPTIRMVEYLAEGTSPVLANSTQIEQIVLNLCKNAVDAIGDKAGRIEIRVEDSTISSSPADQPDLKPGAYVRLMVADDGKGILPSDRERLFMPFFTTKKIGAGTGLGLAVVKGIMREHSGHIIVRSEPGKGSSFEMLFPVLVESQVQDKAMGGGHQDGGARNA